MAADAQVAATVDEISSADNWNRRVSLIRQIPERFGSARQQEVYAAIAEAVYVTELAPTFAYVHWRDDYELPAIEQAYAKAIALTATFQEIDADSLRRAITAAPETVRIFRLLLGFTTQEFAGSSFVLAVEIGAKPLSNAVVKSMEAGRPARGDSARLAAAVIDRGMRRELFTQRSADIRNKIDKPDTAEGWQTIRKYATGNVPLPVFLHQRHYGGAFRQLLDATSGRRGGVLENAVTDLFQTRRVPFVATTRRTKALIAERFGITMAPAPDFVVHDASSSLKAMLECKQANDGGTARDKADRFASLKRESVRLGGVPVFAVLDGLGWRRTGDTLGPVIRDTDGRVFTANTLEAMLTVEPFPGLVGHSAA